MSQSPEINMTQLSSTLAEQALLGLILLDPNQLDALEFLEPSHFYVPAHQCLFESFRALHQKNGAVDLILLIEHLRSQNKLNDVGEETYLWELTNNSTGAYQSLFSYAHSIRDKYLLRKAFAVGRAIMEKSMATDESTLDEKIDWMETQLYDLRTVRKSSPWQSGRSLINQVMEKIDQAAHKDFSGLKTGFTDLDELTLGLRPSQLIILAARPSMGKTTLALNIVTHIAKEKPVLFFSLETPVDDLLLKVVSAEQKIPLPNLQKGNLHDNQWHQLMDIGKTELLDKLFLEEPIQLGLHELRSRIRRFIKEQGSLSLVVVDYLQLMSLPNYTANQRVAEISEISRGLKTIAREFKIPVLALSQLNRELERRPDKRPMMADLRESGSIEQDADLILFIYRDEVYNPETAVKGSTELLIAKHRNGQTGRVNLSFEGKLGQFSNKGV